MKILTNENFSILSQPLEKQGKLFCSFTITGGFSLVDGTALPEAEISGRAMRALQDGEVLDSGVPKKRAEWLADGAACAPEGESLTRQVADIQVGDSRRCLLAGDGKTSFTALPLTWENTRGAPDAPDNPLGCGRKADAHGKICRPAVSEAGHDGPACFGARGAWPCRMKNMGTYDKAWLKSRWPAFPDDMDWSFFNLAQPAQHLASFFRGGEEIRISGMHPVHQHLRCRVPATDLCFEILRTGTEKWERVPVSADTLWLFPGELGGMLLWHGLALCADEAASDISAARLAGTGAAVEMPAGGPPASAESTAAGGAAASKAAPAAAAAVAAGAAAVAAGVAAVAAGVAGTAGASSASPAASPGSAAAGKAENSAAPEAAPENAAAPRVGGQTAPEPPQEAAFPMSASDHTAAMEKIFTESLDGINAALAEQKLPPLTEEQKAEVLDRIARGGQDIATVQQKLEEPVPDLPELLQARGVPPEQCAAVMQAVNMPVPSRDDFPDAASWNAAVTAHLAQIAALLHPSPELGARVAKVASIITGGEAALTAMLPPTPDNVEAALIEKGLPPQQAAAAGAALEQPLPMDQGFTGLVSFGKMVEAQAGFAAGSITDRLKKAHDMLVQLGAIEPEPAMAQMENIPAAPFVPPAAGAEPQKAPETEPAAQAARSVEPPAAPGAAAASPAVEKPSDSGSSGSSSQLPSGAVLVAGILATAGTLAGAKLAGAKLAYMDFSGQDFSNADLSGADITQTRFTGCRMNGLTATGARAAGSQWQGATLTGANLEGIHAPDADFSKADIGGASFRGAECPHADFSEVQALRTNFSSADLEKTAFYNSTCKKADFSHASMRRADFYGGDVSGADFSGASAQDMNFSEKGKAVGTNFSGADLRNCAWDGVDGTGARFPRARLQGAGMTGCHFPGSVFSAASAVGADFSRTNFTGADLRGINGMNASLREAGLTGADISYSSLYGADLHRWRVDRDSKMDGVDFINTIVAAREK